MRNHPTLSSRDLSDVALKVARKADLALPKNYSFIFQLARIESNYNPSARAGSHFGLFQFSTERAAEITSGAYFVNGGFCDRLGLKGKKLSASDLYNPNISVVLALDSIIWANVNNFSEFYCLHILPGAFMALERGKLDKAMRLFNRFVFKKQSKEAESIVRHGINLVNSRRL